MTNFSTELNNWESKIKAKERVVEWLRSLEPEDMAILLRCLAQTALHPLLHNSKKYDEYLYRVALEFEYLANEEWHIKREAYDFLLKVVENDDVTLGYNTETHEFYARFGQEESGKWVEGKTFFQLIAKGMTDWGIK